MSQDPPPLRHHPSRVEGPVNPGSNSMMVRHSHPGYDGGPRSAGPRIMTPMMGDGFPSEFNRPPSHSGMCLSPGSAQGQASQSMMQPGVMDMHGSYMSQSNVMPPSDNPDPIGSIPGHPGCNPPSNLQRIPEFDLSGILPSDKPSETLSYFPSGGGTSQDTSQLEPTANMTMRSPPMTQQSINRWVISSRDQLDFDWFSLATYFCSFFFLYAILIK